MIISTQNSLTMSIALQIGCVLDEISILTNYCTSQQTLELSAKRY
jgi:hypothetical protein